MSIKDAVLGSNNYHEIMQQIGIKALQKQAGYVPDVDDIPVKKPSLQGRLRDISLQKNTNYSLYHALQFAHGHGWICGSAALYMYVSYFSDSTQWRYGDIDIFAHDASSYDVMVSKLSGVDVKHEQSCKGWLGIIGMATTINVIKPPPGKTWHSPFDVWSEFDLNVACAAIVSPDLVLIETTVEDGYLHPLQKLRSATRFVTRVKKYMTRGFRMHDTFWNDALIFADKNGRFDEYVDMFRLLMMLDGNRDLTVDIPRILDRLDGGGDSYETDSWH